MRTVETLREAVDAAKHREQVMVRCPGHDDNAASLHVTHGDKHPVLMTCHAGCTIDQILEAESRYGGITGQDLMAPRDENFVGDEEVWTPAGPASHVYQYTDEEGTLLYEVLRVPLPGGKKTFRQRAPIPGPKPWKWSMDGVRRVLYRLPEVLQAKANGEVIYIVEGEKDVETLRLRAGVTATTSPMGAGKWNESYSEMLRGANVVIIADADNTGRAHARSIREELLLLECAVSLKEPMNGQKDVTDHFNMGGTLDSLLETVPDEEEKRVSLGVDILQVITRTVKPSSFVIPGTLARGDRLLVTGYEGHGKALAVDTPVLTMNGWSTMGQLDVGDVVFAADGLPTHIKAKSEILTGRPCYRVEFSDGSSIVADANHLWVTDTLASREASARQRRRGETKARGTDQRNKRVHVPTAVTTEHIAATLHARDGHALNHSIETCGPLQFPERDLPVGAYTLGAWLGDGTSASARITVHPDDKEIIEEIRKEGYSVEQKGEMSWTIRGERRWVGSLQASLRTLGVLGNKNIPASYLYASQDQRLSLLQGLMDTDGSVNERGDCEYTGVNFELVNDVMALALSLGIKATVSKGAAMLNGVFISEKWRVLFRTDLPVFRLTRKLERQTTRTTARHRLRYITAVVPVQSVPVKCISVTHESGTFVAGHNLIPTHNSTLCQQMAVQVAAGIHPWTRAEVEPQKVVVIDSENHPDQLLEKWQHLVGLAARHNRPIQPGQLTIIEAWDDDVDLTSDEGAAWLMERMHGYKPDLCVIGPLYNLSSRDLSEHSVVGRMKQTVNEARGVCGTAFIMEHHAPHRGAGETKRSVRPYGSSTFLKWPDFGYGLLPLETEGVYEWQKTRFPRVRSRLFPTHLRWGKPNTDEFMWEATEVDENGNVLY